jgi:Holliday junction resolvase-like predicted endonuclease
VANTSRKGNEGERVVGKWYAERGYILGSRRHIKGPGDWLVVHPETGRVLLVEAKKCKNIWDNFRPKEREEMKAMKLPPGAERLLVNVISVKNKELAFFGEKTWP